jgi:hypothetical protein
MSTIVCHRQEISFQLPEIREIGRQKGQEEKDFDGSNDRKHEANEITKVTIKERRRKM